MDVSVICWMWQCSYYSHFCKWILTPISESRDLSGVDHIHFLGRFFDHAGDFTWTYQSVAGCDSGYYSHFCKWYLFYFWILQFVRVGHIRFLGGLADHAGDFTWTYQSVAGCDSVVTIHISVNDNLFYFWIPCNLSGWILSIALGRFLLINAKPGDFMDISVIGPVGDSSYYSRFCKW